jgi:hypothetical protein
LWGTLPDAGPPGTYAVRVEILLWLVPPAVVTVLAMLWATWAGRDRRRPDTDDSEAAYDRFVAAVQKPHPTAGKGVGPAPTNVASGVAVRRSRPMRGGRTRR